MKKITDKKTNRNFYFLPHIVIAIVTCVAMVTIIQWDRSLFRAEFREGDIALRDIYAPYDFNIKGGINVKASERAKKTALEAVLPVYVLDTEAEKAVLKKVESIVDSVKALMSSTDIADEEKLLKIKEIATSHNISESLVTKISKSRDLQVFLNELKKAIDYFMSRGIIASLGRSRLKDNKIRTINVIDKSKGTETRTSVNGLYSIEDLKKKKELFSSFVRDKRQRALVSDFVNAILSVNIIYDKEKTQARKDAAIEELEPIYNIIKVKKNETIINKGERIGKEHIAKLKGIEQNQNESSVMKIGGIFGVSIVIGLFILLSALYIKFYEPEFITKRKELALLAIICILIVLIAKIIVISPWSSNIIPVAVASMLIAILINMRIAIVVTCFLSILIGMLSGNILDIAGVSMIGGSIGIFAMRGVRRRSQVIAAGLCVGFANMSYLIGMGLIRSLDFNTYITESLFGLANGIISAVVVTGVLPIFENTFKITTDISLLELADLNHPLLKEMVIKAPGTYHHSLVVGNLAEAACEAIGANSLLARVGSYFHDIGKIEKASYFSENQSIENSAHDKLSPTMSSLIITNHVKNGVELARKHKLSKNIIDIIRQHHGTSLVFYFFKRALENIADKEVGEQSFRYPGPKPQTKEAACVLLADSVEAASRALDEPTPSRIKSLVRKIINNKFTDGQLDECDLTLKDLEKIAEVFIHILTGIFHTRVEYPEGPEEIKGA